MDRRTKATLNRDKAIRLNEAWAVGATQVRYSDDGHWYATLTRFPAALFDAHGYVLFATPEEYRTSTYIRIGKQISVPKPCRHRGDRLPFSAGSPGPGDQQGVKVALGGFRVESGAQRGR